MSMAWMPKCGQTWLGTAASFLSLRVVMMVAMTLPSLVPTHAGTVWRHGLRLGLHCSYCCAGLTAILLVVGRWLS
jgi:hypothetical protein